MLHDFAVVAAAGVAVVVWVVTVAADSAAVAEVFDVDVAVAVVADGAAVAVVGAYVAVICAQNHWTPGMPQT